MPAEPETAASRREREPARSRELLFLVILTVLEGFFVAAEIALVSIRRSRVEQLVEEGNRGARRVRRLLDDPGRFLAVAQLGLTFIGFFASAFAAVSLADGSPACSSRSSWPAERPAGIALRDRDRDAGAVHDRVRASSSRRRSRSPTPSGSRWRCRGPIDFLGAAARPGRRAR